MDQSRQIKDLTNFVGFERREEKKIKNGLSANGVDPCSNRQDSSLESMDAEISSKGGSDEASQMYDMNLLLNNPH